MIVTPEGLNVFPEDVERVLNELPGVTESAVVGAPLPGSTAERVQAVIVAAPGTDLDEVVRQANAAAAGSSEDPRGGALAAARASADRRHAQAEATRAAAVADRQSGGEPRRSAKPDAAGRDASPPSSSASRRAERSRPSTTIDELGLSSLERVELMMALEEALQVTVDEVEFAAAATVGDLEALDAAARRGGGRGRGARASRPSRSTFPTLEPVAAGARASAREPADLDSAAREVVRVARGPRASSTSTTIDGAGDLRRQPPEPPRHADDPPGAAAALALPGRAGDGEGILQGALLSGSIRRDRRGLTNSLNYYLASAFFNAFPLPQRETGTRQTLRYIGELHRRRATRC